MLVISGVLFQVHDLLKGGAAKSTSEIITKNICIAIILLSSYEYLNYDGKNILSNVMILIVLIR
jgi:hypothetical protein